MTFHRTAALIGRAAIALLCLGTLAATHPAFQPITGPPPMRHELSIEEQIVEAALAEGIPPQLAINTAWRESRFRNVVSRTHDFGPLQLNDKSFPGAARMTMAQNIRAGVAYLAVGWRRYHSERLAWIAYNQGPGRAERVARGER